MGYDMTEPLTGKPIVEMKSRRLDLERRLAQMVEVEVDRVVWRGTNRAGNTGEHGQCGAMDVAGGDELHARMTANEGGQLSRVGQVLAVHVPDARDEWRMMQKHKRRPIW
jgi:hypothetical protein